MINIGYLCFKVNTFRKIINSDAIHPINFLDSTYLNEETRII